MHDVTVRMKDGRNFCGPLWEFRPKEGWFRIVDDCPDQLYFRDVESAVCHGQRTGVVSPGVPRIEDVDLLERARREGWDGT